MNGSGWLLVLMIIGIFGFGWWDHVQRQQPEQVEIREQQVRDARQEFFNDEIDYFKDARTDLCFAYGRRGHGGYMAHVPCDKVEDFLE